MAVRRLVPWVLAVTLVLACALVLLLAKRVRDLSADYRQLRLLSTLPHAGTVVPTFRTATLAGDSITVGETADSGESQILYVFNTSCPYCRAIIPIWEQIADSLKRLKRPVQVLAISLDSADTTRRYVAEHALPYPVLTFPQAKLKRLFRAGTVPQTVVLDSRGTVLYARTGTLDSVSLDSVYAAVTGRPIQ
jgi:peroxiredoxin